MLNNLKQLVCRVIDDDITALAAQLAYDLLLSFFPFLLLLISMLSYSNLESKDVLIYLHQIMPKSAFDLIYTTVIEVLDSRNVNLLSISIIGIMWSGSSGFRAIIKGLNKAYDEEETRPFWKTLAISILFMLGLVVAIIVGVALVVFGQMIGGVIATRLNLSSKFILDWDIIRYLVSLGGMSVTFAALYHYTPCRRLTWIEVIPGAIVSTLGWLISSLGFAYYVNNFNNYSGLYGGIGAVIVLMLWLYIISIIILLGGEVNALLAFEREGKQKPRCKKY
ncbi:YihY/virulence factor BrkB family protein [Clostridium sp. CM028]|uniref:YihY/virulence factor BrkB family protein n=1 Tax=Clostridium TaxID=1485 RepID=UPI0013EED49D|nr:MULTISPECIES: YihY/virulence factor BrkB family protein [Clostridium]MBU3093191.1 YihY/virulence factor BrkB family protein [Clostridium sp. CF011]MBW9145224.1 YihY/virulence factor BrkB family protein [Clostridium sp. CM027]MBW9148465.1 YihY/virulence factor BrkB family protein [Clostridium sp. CM028]MBZ9609379.1 YihY/virulence factor BrkB family protein [Clostridium estertheticum]UVE40357.1 YihY/virulence factor BrkB family protein [Clostridium sp. CM027]